jgi:sRNA-binding protein
MAYRDRSESEHVIRMLAEKYPQCFFEEPKLRRPLKKTIVSDLTDDGFPVARELLAVAVEWYQSHFAYHYRLEAEAERIDLNGKAVGKVTEKEALDAQGYIAERQREMNEQKNLMGWLNRAEKKSDNLSPRLPAPRAVSSEPKMPDPVARLQTKLDAVRQATMNTSDEALSNAFIVVGLKVLINDAERMIEDLQSNEQDRRRTEAMNKR